MTRPHSHTPNLSPRHGFSLVEIVIALGIVSFILIALIGLNSAALDLMKESQLQTYKAQMLQEAITRIRTQPWDKLTNVEIYFDSEGALVTNASAAHFVCRSRSIQSPSFWTAGTNTMAFKILTLEWPVGANNTNTLRVPINAAYHE